MRGTARIGPDARLYMSLNTTVTARNIWLPGCSISGSIQASSLLSDLGEQNMHSMSLFYYLLMFLHVMKLFFFFAFSYSVFAETFSCWNSSWLACFAPAITANSCLSQKPLFHCIATLANRTFRTIPSTRNNHNYGVMLATVISCEQLRKWRSEYRFFFSLMAPL